MHTDSLTVSAYPHGHELFGLQQADTLNWFMPELEIKCSGSARNRIL